MRFSTYWRRAQAGLLRTGAAIGALVGLKARPGYRRRRALTALVVAVAGAMTLLVASALGVVAGLGSPTKFEAGDGNMTLQESGYLDWNCFSKNESIRVTENKSTCGSFNAKNYVSMPAPHAYTTQDIAWKPGQKQDTSCPGLVESKSPAKDTFTNIASYNETEFVSNKLGHTYLFGATIRFTANGNASENVELNHERGTTTGCSIPRTAGDKLIGINYLNGGTKVEIKVLTWITLAEGKVGGNEGKCLVSNDVPPCWGAKEKTIEASAGEGKANSGEIEEAANGISEKKLAAGQFAEFGIDLTAAGVIPENSCESFPQTVWESRSSGSSFVSNPEDIEIEQHEISNCGEIKVIKQTNPRGVNQVFGFESETLPANSKAGGVACTTGGSAGIAEKGSFCLNDTGNEGKELGSTAEEANSKQNTVDAKKLVPGEYKINEGEEPSGFKLEKVSCEGGTTSIKEGKVTVTLEPEAKVTCLFVNEQQFGALQIKKVSSKKAHTPLAGAEFSVTSPGKVTTKKETNSEGVVCMDKLTELGKYTVKEIKAPAGYAIDNEEEVPAEVTSTNAKCGDKEFKGQELEFEDTPLTEISASAKSEATGGTKSEISCTEEGGKEVGEAKSGESPTVSAKELKPGTYNCKVVVDP